MRSPNCLLIGAGPMAEAYAQVVKEFESDLTVIGRGENSAKRFTDNTGLSVTLGGLQAAIDAGLSKDTCAIVATPVDTLTLNCKMLITAGVKRILVEKPAGLSPEETRELAEFAKARNAEVFVAYNRRFYDSTQRAKALIESDGGPTSLRIEFSEFSERIAPLPTHERIKEAWLYANSTHVLDLGFYLAGFPKVMSCKTQGKLSWHPSGAQFVGHGETELGALFSYSADWEAAPRWAVEVGTRERTIMLQPLEQLRFREKTGFAETSLEIDQIDKDFKPGLWRQTEAFLGASEAQNALCDIADHAHHMSHVYEQIVAGE